ncbi:MAG: spore protease YyaC [Clostridiaceae bacterium]
MNRVNINYEIPLAYYEIGYFMKDYIDKNTAIVCIGTDKCIGDCLGPLIGTMLKDKFFPIPVYGTLSNPIHALNLNNKLKEIKSTNPYVNLIGIDACLGDIESIGSIQARDYPIHPGKGVGKDLPEVGSASIIGIVDSFDSSNIFNNNSIRLNLILNMAKVITDALVHSFYMKNSTNK